MRIAVPQSGDDSRVPRFAFSVANPRDAAALSRCMTGWSHVYEQVDRGQFSARVTELWLWPVQVVHESLHQPCVYRGAAWRNSLTFALPLQTPGKMVCFGRQLAGGTLMVHRGRTPGLCFINGPVDNLFITVDRNALATFAESMGLLAQRDLALAGELICQQEATGKFHAMVQGILEELEAQPGLLECELYRRAVQEQVLRLLVGVMDVKASMAGKSPRPTTRAYVVEKADQFMLTRLAEPISVSDISSAVRVSMRTLRYSFEDVVGVSPAQYLQGMRLNRVRDALLSANGRVQVRSVAERNGFRHLGRFAKYYQAAFGELPTDTCKRAGLARSFASKRSPTYEL